MNYGESEFYAIIPAAGRSRRMGRSKLMLPWPTCDRPDGTLADHVLSVWTSSCVTRIVVVVRADDEQLADTCSRWPVTLVRPDVPPSDMKESVQRAIQFISEHYQPTEKGRCFIAPADLPALTHTVIDRMAAVPFDPERIVVPLFGCRQGHPALLPWVMMSEVFTLSDDEGIDQIVKRHRKTLVSFAAADFVADIDTPDEYQDALKAASRVL